MNRTASLNRLAAWCSCLMLAPSVPAAPLVLGELLPHLVNYYDWQHPAGGNAAQELDQGSSQTNLQLVNGGGSMRVNDGAFRASTGAVQTRQVDPASNVNNDWKVGIYQPNPGVASLGAFNAVREITLAGWVKPAGGATNPSLNSETANPNDFFNAVGLFGLLQGGSGNNGHNVRALLEIINVGGTQRLVALGRRLDTGSSQTFYATADWHALVPDDVWTFLTATFDYDTGVLGLYVNGEAVAGEYQVAGNPWALTAGIDVTSATHPGGIKIGGSFPQNSEDRNPFNGRFDDIMTFDRALTADQVRAQYLLMVNAVPEPSALALALLGLGVIGTRARRRRAS